MIARTAHVSSDYPARRAASMALALFALMATIGCALAGTVKPFHYPCPSLGKEQVAEVYVPSGEEPEDGWPVLYLLHGLHGGSNDWNNLGNIGATLDRLIAMKKIKPLLVVMPDGANSWYVDSADVSGPGNYATAIGVDLQAAVEAAFPVGTDRSHRAIAGVSMGGYGALRLALLAPERYAAVAALSPAIWQNFPAQPADPAAPTRHDRSPTPAYFQKIDPDTVTIGIDVPPDGGHFGAAFGTPFDQQRFNAANIFTLLENDVERRKHLPPIYLSVGDDDSHHLWRGSIALFETMQMNNLDLDFRVTDGDHNWTLWKQSIMDALIYLDARLDKPAIR